MSTHLIAAAAIIGAVLAAAYFRFAPQLFIEVLDNLLTRIPARPFLAAAPSRDPVVQSLVMGAALVCGFGLILSLSRLTGFWIVWPAAVATLYLAMGFGVAFATMLWPVVLASGLIVLWFALGALERAGGETVPLSDDGPRVSFLNAMIVLTPLLAGYAAALAARARKAAEKQPTRD